MEREREEGVIRFIRCCERCLPQLNKWAPNVDELATLMSSPWVVQLSVSPLGVHLAEVLRTRPERRQAVLSLLQHLGKPVVTFAGVTLGDISENEWAATALSSSVHHNATSDSRTNSRLIRGAQYFIQQCLDVRVPETPSEKCALAEMDGRRCYPVAYTSPAEPPEVPNHAREAEREDWVMKYQLHDEDILKEEIELICDLVAKEMHAKTGLVSVIVGNRQSFLPVLRTSEGVRVSTNERKHAFSAHLLLSEHKPLLVRNAQHDIRFRNLNTVATNDGISFFFGVPIFAGDGVIVANLLAVDPKPKRHITTMQYSVMTALAEALASIWKETFVPEESPLAKEIDL